MIEINGELVKIGDRTFERYITAREIDALVTKLAAEINTTYKGCQEEIQLISILDGSFIFMADLVRKLNFHHQIHFVKLASYDGTESTGEVKYLLDLEIDITDKHVLIVEDIVDTGLTLESFLSKINKLKPLSARVCTLFSKPEVHNDIVPIDFVGKEVPPVFIIGYGLDINGHARNLPDIYNLKV